MIEPTIPELIHFVAWLERAIYTHCKKSHESTEYISRKVDLLSYLARRARLHKLSDGTYVQGELWND